MIKPIILIGPMATGKSTIANLLAKLTGIPNVPMDRVRWYFYFKDGFSQEIDSSLTFFSEKVAYWKPFEAKAVGRIIAEFPDSIIDFGAGHSSYEDAKLFESVESLLRPLPNIFLLLPSPDKERSLQICTQRLTEHNRKTPILETIETNRFFINHESNYKLAKHIVFTEGKTPEETAAQIMSLVI